MPEIMSVSIPADTPLAKAREAVLDYFHDHVCIGCLDDFEITVELPHGEAPVTEAPSLIHFDGVTYKVR